MVLDRRKEGDERWKSDFVSTRRDETTTSSRVEQLAQVARRTRRIASPRQGKRERTTASRRGSTPDTTTVARLDSSRLESTRRRRRRPRRQCRSLSPRGCTGGAVAITEETLRTGRKNDWWLDAVAILVKIRPEGKKGYWLYRPRWNISRNIGWIILRGIRKACGYEYAYIRMESGVLGRKRWGKLGHGVSSQPPHRTPGCQGSEATAPRSRTHLLLILRCCAHDLMDYEWIFHCSSPKRGGSVRCVVEGWKFHWCWFVASVF